MSLPQNDVSADAYKYHSNEDSQSPSSKEAFGRRLRALIDATGLSDAEIARRSGLSTSGFNRYTSGKGLPGSEQIFAIADALSVDARWLVTGVQPSRSGHLMASAEHADWVDVPEYDLRELTDEGRGPVVSTTPIRKDWLFRTLNQSSGLWMARLPADLPRFDLREGDIVFCRDVDPGEAQDGAIYLVRIWGHLTVARLDAMLGNRMNSVEGNLQDRALAPRDIGTDDGKAILVARVLGAPLRRL